MCIVLLVVMLFANVSLAYQAEYKVSDKAGIDASDAVAKYHGILQYLVNPHVMSKVKFLSNAVSKFLALNISR